MFAISTISIYTIYNKKVSNFPSYTKNFLRELIIIDLELKDRNKTKEFFQNFHSKLEDLLFSIIQKLPEKLIPSPIMNWLDRYTTKRISQLQQQIIKQRWQQNTLERAVEYIRSINQDTKKAPSED